jgi:hypothetical protein
MYHTHPIHVYLHHHGLIMGISSICNVENLHVNIYKCVYSPDRAMARGFH